MRSNRGAIASQRSTSLEQPRRPALLFPIERRDACRMVSANTFVKKKRRFVVQRKTIRYARTNHALARVKTAVKLTGQRKTLLTARSDC
jgi:DTW domain-containing protein YfiP